MLSFGIRQNRKGFAPIIIIVVIAALFAGGYAWWVKHQERAVLNPPISISTSTTPTEQVQPPIVAPFKAATTTVSESASTTAIANWKTYTNDAVGITFKYPSKYFINDRWNIKITDNARYGMMDACDSYYDISFIVATSTEEFDNLGKPGNHQYQDLSDLSLRKIKVDGREGFYVTGVFNKSYVGWGVPSKGEKYASVIIANGSGYVHIAPCGGFPDQSEFDGIVYSLGFIPINKMAGWKTYQNTHYGFSLKYPPDWEFHDRSGTINDVPIIDVLAISPTISDVPGIDGSSAFSIMIYNDKTSFKLMHEEGFNSVSAPAGQLVLTPVTINQDYLKSTDYYKASQLIWQSFHVN